MIPATSHERLVAEAIAFPLWHPIAMHGMQIRLQRDAPGVPGRGAADCGEYLRQRANGASLPQLMHVVGGAWFPSVALRVSLADHVARVADEHLELRGARVGLRQDGGTLPEMATRWRWLSLALPCDLLVAALAALHEVEPPSEHVELVTAHLARTLQAPCAETHLHVGAGISFGVLWTGLLRHVAHGLDNSTKIQERFGADVPLGDADRYLRLLRASALARLALASFLMHRERGVERFEAFLNRWIEQLVGRLPWWRGPDDLRRELRALLATLCMPTRPFRPEHRRDRELLNLLSGARPPLREDPQESLIEGDPLVSWLPPNGHAALPETRFVARALSHVLRVDPDDEGFAMVFWQYQRVRNATFRLLTQEPGTAGLDWFTRFYNRIGFFREALPTHRGQEPSWFYALETQARDLYLGALEARTRPDQTPREILTLARDVARQALVHAERTPGRARPEVGVVLHYIKASDYGLPNKTRRSHGDPDNRAFGARHAVWFTEQRSRALAVVRALRDHPELVLVLRGVDAANLEQAQPTWVLRPLFDLVRRESQVAARRMALARPSWRVTPFRATLHAGEDCLRVVEGVRRMHEAIEFGVLHQGDRFGHGLAVGLDPTSEARTVVAQPREERLDDLLWELDRYARGELVAVTWRVEKVRREARELALELYRSDDATNVEALSEARRMRHDPDTLLWRLRYPAVDRSREAERASGRLLVRYLTDRDVYARGQVPVAVESTPDERAMLADAQSWLRRELGRREITIESNPSSNLLIGDLRALEEHPAMRLQPLHASPRTDAVQLSVNTDNPVTFASCLADEFAFLYAALLERGVPASDALEWIDRRREDGWRSRFTLQASALPDELDRVLAPARHPRDATRRAFARAAVVSGR